MAETSRKEVEQVRWNDLILEGLLTLPPSQATFTRRGVIYDRLRVA
jgi:hypothetical protein